MRRRHAGGLNLELDVATVADHDHREPAPDRAGVSWEFIARWLLERRRSPDALLAEDKDQTFIRTLIALVETVQKVNRLTPAERDLLLTGFASSLRMLESAQEIDVGNEEDSRGEDAEDYSNDRHKWAARAGER